MGLGEVPHVGVKNLRITNFDPLDRSVIRLYAFHHPGDDLSYPAAASEIYIFKTPNFLQKWIPVVLDKIRMVLICSFALFIVTTVVKAFIDEKKYKGETTTTVKVGDEASIETKPPTPIEYVPIESLPKQPETSKFIGNHLKNGDSPFNPCLGKSKRKGPSWILFQNRNDADAVVSLVNNYTGSTIRNEYIRAGNSFKMSNVPEGEYTIKTVFGNDWNPNLKSPCGSKGFFESNVSYSISDGLNGVLSISNIFNTYSTYTVTLYTVANGNMSQRNISAEQFFGR